MNKSGIVNVYLSSEYCASVQADRRLSTGSKVALTSLYNMVDESLKVYCSQKEFGETFAASRGAAKRALKRLEDYGHIRRHQERGGRRATNIILTPPEDFLGILKVFLNTGKIIRGNVVLSSHPSEETNVVSLVANSLNVLQLQDFTNHMKTLLEKPNEALQSR